MYNVMQGVSRVKAPWERYVRTYGEICTYIHVVCVGRVPIAPVGDQPDTMGVSPCSEQRSPYVC
eukprot:COSAG05_NODE_912_length_6631_cov_192.387171_7_plen_64_part_00